MKLSRSWTTLPVFLVALAMLFAGFTDNRWNVADQRWFEAFSRDMEAHVVARIVETRSNGALSAGGLLGIGTLDGRPVEFSDWSNVPFEEQFEAYESGATFTHYEAYLSQIGLQGSVFAMLDRLVTGDAQSKLDAFGKIAALLSAVALAFVVTWFFLELGWVAAAAVLAGCLASQWLVIFGNRMFWSAWAFYVPLLVPAFYLRALTGAPDGRELRHLGLLLAAAMFTKTLFNGYEFVSTVVVMALVPVVYYAVRDQWPLKAAMRAVAAVALGAGAAGAVSLAILVGQIGAVKSDAWAGVRHIALSFERRTHPSEERLPDVEGQSTSVGEVVRLYLGAEWTKFGRYLRGSTRLMPASLRSATYGTLIVVFVLASIGLWMLARQSAVDRALLAATWVSLFAPLSWLVGFKSHAAVHTFMDEVVWQMPFALFGFAVLGRCAVAAWRRAVALVSSGGAKSAVGDELGRQVTG